MPRRQRSRGLYLVLLYLGFIGLVGGITTGLFSGSGFLLLGQPSEEIYAGSRSHDRTTEVGPLRPGGSSANAENGTLFAEISRC